MIHNTGLAYKFGDNGQTIFLDECPDITRCRGEWIGSLNGATIVRVCIIHNRATVNKNKFTDLGAPSDQQAEYYER